MGIASKLRVLKRHYQAAANGHDQVWQNSNLLALARRSGLKLTGAFLLLAIAAVAVIGSRASAANNLSASPAASNKQVTVQVSHATASSTPTAAPATTEQAAPTNTDVSSDTTADNGTSSTQVTVNGQSVDVPANGSTQQTINGPDQQTTVQVSNTQSGSGDVQTSTFSHTDIHTSTNSEEDTTP